MTGVLVPSCFTIDIVCFGLLVFNASLELPYEC